MNTVLEFTTSPSWCQLASKLSLADQYNVRQLVAPILGAMETGKYPPKSQENVDCRLISETLRQVTDTVVGELQFCSVNDVRRHGLRIGTIALSFNDSAPDPGLVFAQCVQGRRLIDSIGEKWRARRVQSINNAWSACVANFVQEVQELVMVAAQQSVIKVFDPALTIGYLLSYFLHFLLANDTDGAVCLRSILQVVTQECLPLVHMDDKWIVLVA